MRKVRDLLISGGLAGAGLCYGLLLLAFGFLATGAGHGTIVVAGLSSSPVGLTQRVLLAIFAPPVLWCMVGAMLGWVTQRTLRGLFLATMLAWIAHRG